MRYFIYEKNYEGFESLQDYERDTYEALDSRFNELMRIVPIEFKGTIKVEITYEESDDDRCRNLFQN